MIETGLFNILKLLFIDLEHLMSGTKVHNVSDKVCHTLKQRLCA